MVVRALGVLSRKGVMCFLLQGPGTPCRPGLVGWVRSRRGFRGSWHTFFTGYPPQLLPVSDGWRRCIRLPNFDDPGVAGLSQGRIGAPNLSFASNNRVGHPLHHQRGEQQLVNTMQVADYIDLSPHIYYCDGPSLAFPGHSNGLLPLCSVLRTYCVLTSTAEFAPRDIICIASREKR
jgi:hypothetical protein